MTREEEIKRASVMYHLYYYDYSYEEGEHLDFYIKGFTEGDKWADKNPNSRTIAEYLYKEKGYPISLNGDIPTFEETMKDVQTYNTYKKEQWIEKACNWLREQKEMIGISFQEDFIERFKMAMKK